MSEGFDVNKSVLSDESIAAFVDEPLSSDITTVPGIGEASAAQLATSDDPADVITTTHQLLGKFLSFFADGVSGAQACDALWFYLQARNVRAHRSGIITALSEKLNAMVPGLIDMNELDDA